MTKADVRKQFSRNSEKYVTSHIHAQGEDLARLLQIMTIKKTDHVLDVATGGGHVANALAPHVKQVTAFDITEDMLAVARRFMARNGHDNVTFVLGDAEEMPFASGIFDTLTCRIAAHHFPNIRSFLKESFRVLKPGGQWLIIDNIAPEDDEQDHFYNTLERMRDASHHRSWKKTEWLAMLKAQGFTVEASHHFDKVISFEDWCERMSLSKERVRALTDFVLQTPSNLKDRFRFLFENGSIKEFQIQSVLFKAVKPNAMSDSKK